MRNSVEACAIDTRRALYGAVVLAGGTSLSCGLPERLSAELTSLLQRDFETEPFRVTVVASAGRDELVWRGGAELAELMGPDPTRWVTRDEFESDGVGAVLRKCPAVQSATRTAGS